MPADRRLAIFAAAIDRLTAVVGRAVTWGLLAMVLVQVTVVLMRYVLGHYLGGQELHTRMILRDLSDL